MQLQLFVALPFVANYIVEFVALCVLLNSNAVVLSIPFPISFPPPVPRGEN